MFDYMIDVPCFSGQSFNQCQFRNHRRQRTTKQLRQRNYFQSFSSSTKLCGEQRSQMKKLKKNDKWTFDIRKLQQTLSWHLLKFYSRLFIETTFNLTFFLILMLSSIQVDGFVEEQLTHQKQQDESIMAIFHDIHEGQEVELQRMVYLNFNF